MALSGRTKILLGAVLHVQQPFGEAVMKKHQCAGTRDRYHPSQQMEPAIEVLHGDADAGRLHALVQNLLSDGQFGGKYDVE